MPAEIGKTTLNKTGRDVRCIADGNYGRVKSGGISLAMSTVPTNGGGSAIILKDDTSVPVGAAYLRFGQVLAKITTAGSFTITVTGTPTGGTFAMTVTDPRTFAETIITVPFNSSVAALQTQLDAVFGAGNTVASGAGALPGNVQTVTLAGALLGYTFVNPSTSSTLLTGGSTPAAATAIVNSGSNTGLFGPYDPAASDGRQTLTRGECFVLDRTWVDLPAFGTFGLAGLHPCVFDGGRVWFERIIQSGVATHTLAAGPTLAEFLAAFPEISFVKN